MLNTSPHLGTVAVDVGNTRIKWYSRHADGRQCFFATAHAEGVNWAECRQRLLDFWQSADSEIVGLRWAIAGVNPPQLNRLAEWLSNLGEAPVRIKHYSQLPIRVDLPEPERVGIDRLLSAVAVQLHKAPEQAAIIVDAGTAVTVNALAAEGVFLGGAIAPGWRTMRLALHQQTARLPFVEGAPEPGRTLPGKSTRDAIALGTRELYLGGVDRLIHQTKSAFSGPVAIYFTGGDGELLAKGLPHWNGAFVPTLTLEGLWRSAFG